MAPQLPQDPLVQALVPDPTQIPNLVVLVGYLGRNSDKNDGRWRLYLTPAMNDYIIFERTALVHYKDLPSGGSIVWLKGDATVQRTQVESRKLQAEFLQGKMMDDAQTSMPGFPKGSDGPGGANYWTYVGCPPSVWHC